MGVNQFFRASHRLSLDEVVRLTGAKIGDGASRDVVFDSVGPIDEAGPGGLAFVDNPRYASGLGSTRAGACFVQERFAHRLPKGTIALVVSEPYRAFATVVGRMFPDALRPTSMFGTTGISPGAFIHPEARLEAGVTVDPGVVIGPRAEIGSGTVIGPNAVIGPDVRIGRDCAIGANTTVMAALVGNRVILHGGVRIGQDGFGFAMSGRGHLKVPQIGRVIIQDDVEVGANTTIDRGSVRDTIIGEGAKIDNLVQIAHNVIIGRHCVLVSQTGISGSTKLGDFAVTGGQAGLAGHLTLGAGAQLSAKAGLSKDIPAGESWGGYPARPLRDWLREEACVRDLARGGAAKIARRGSKS